MDTETVTGTLTVTLLSRLEDKRTSKDSTMPETTTVMETTETEMVMETEMETMSSIWTTTVLVEDINTRPRTKLTQLPQKTHMTTKLKLSQSLKALLMLLLSTKRKPRSLLPSLKPPSSTKNLPPRNPLLIFLLPKSPPLKNLLKLITNTTTEDTRLPASDTATSQLSSQLLIKPKSQKSFQRNPPLSQSTHRNPPLSKSTHLNQLLLKRRLLFQLTEDTPPRPTEIWPTKNQRKTARVSWDPSTASSKELSDIEQFEG